MNPIDVIKGLEKQKKLSLIEKVLAVTTGSVTQTLEAYLEEPVGIRTLNQEVKEAGPFARDLGVGKKDEVNFREVEIINPRGKVLIIAKSWTPIKRLLPAFRDDLMKADVPIGKLLEKHHIEVRRELVKVWIENGNVRRTYNIISGGKILMRIEESLSGISALCP